MDRSLEAVFWDASLKTASFQEARLVLVKIKPKGRLEDTLDQEPECLVLGRETKLKESSAPQRHSVLAQKAGERAHVQLQTLQGGYQHKSRLLGLTIYYESVLVQFLKTALYDWKSEVS